MDTTRTTTTTSDMWTHRDQETWDRTDISGFGVEAIDGEIGSVDEATYDIGGSFVVVDTGPWIFGKKVMLPAGVISAIDFENELVRIDRTKDEIESAPEFDEATYRDTAYRDDLAAYYDARRAGYRD